VTFVVGITGGIGSGKTAVSDRFRALGIEIVDADVASREVVKPGMPALAEIRRHFGESVIQPDGALDRAALRQKVFADPAERQWLERLLHPSINAWIREQLTKATSPYVILVSPIMFETQQHLLTDRVLVVDVPESVQLARTMARDNNSETQVRSIMAAQTSREKRLERADDVIVNDGGLETLDREVAALHRKYLELAAKNRAD